MFKLVSKLRFNRINLLQSAVFKFGPTSISQAYVIEISDDFKKPSL